MSRQRLRERRNQLWSQSPLCRRCGCVTIRPEDLGAKYGSSNHAPADERRRMATIEHIASRIAGARPFIGGVTLWCWACNQQRGSREVAALGLHEQRRRSRRGLAKCDFEDPESP